MVTCEQLALPFVENGVSDGGIVAIQGQVFHVEVLEIEDVDFAFVAVDEEFVVRLVQEDFHFLLRKFLQQKGLLKRVFQVPNQKLLTHHCNYLLVQSQDKVHEVSFLEQLHWIFVIASAQLHGVDILSGRYV